MHTQQNETDFDLFDHAFDEAVKDLPAATASEVEKDKDVAAPDSGKDAAVAAEGRDAPASADEPPAAATTTTTTDGEVKDETPAEAEDPATPAPDYARQTVDLLDQLVKKGTSPAPADAASDKAQPAVTSQDRGGAEPEPFTAEQTALLTTFDEEFPEVSRAVALRTEKAVQTAVGALMRQLRSELAPMVTYYVQTAGDSHMGTIRGAHTDFDTLTPKVLEWIGKQPAGLRNAYTAITKDGSAEDVIALFNTYKKANGFTSQPQEPSTEASVTTVKKPAAEVQKAAASLAVIPGQRAVVPKGGVDKNDFHAAWGEATAA